MTPYFIQSHYPHTELPRTCPILLMQSARLVIGLTRPGPELPISRIRGRHSIDSATEGTWVICCFTSYLRSYQDWYRLVTMHTHVDFIVFPHCGHQIPSVYTFNVTLKYSANNEGQGYEERTILLPVYDRTLVAEPIRAHASLVDDREFDS